MDPTYRAVAEAAQQIGLVYCVALFALVLAYALWPSRKKTFEEAARIPLKED